MEGLPTSTPSSAHALRSVPTTFRITPLLPPLRNATGACGMDPQAPCHLGCALFGNDTALARTLAHIRASHPHETGFIPCEWLVEYYTTLPLRSLTNPTPPICSDMGASSSSRPSTALSSLHTDSPSYGCSPTWSSTHMGKLKLLCTPSSSGPPTALSSSCLRTWNSPHTELVSHSHRTRTRPTPATRAHSPTGGPQAEFPIQYPPNRIPRN